ncbi:PEP-CTERM sorting domain-containing protein [Luteolibacter luteus]|uniref:PEP-CTERM sorting domain-containing protein n=1 Tax=Luteolibacter luteus TaxID=2728835 RepID=A0A858RCI3_9BACT|nr:PEP-CTERM sorting domain-containing protein [Luteolibacter luteus]QJE94308.1 PEP-CTERM sorting domain-containing protein [Luteolibacter luteus]
MILNHYLPLAALLFSLSPAKSAVVVSYAETPGQYNSTLEHTSVYNFDDRATGNYSNVTTGIGTYDTLTINPVDQYGGAGDPNGSQYAVQGANGPGATTLTLDIDAGYFGLWWSAGDNQNVLEFYNDTDLVARFTTQTLLTAITAAGGYQGNPASGTYHGNNSSEPYAFVNFFGVGDTTWNRIVFTNTSGSGFESDNHTIRELTWGGYTPEIGQPLPGITVAQVEGNTVTVVPEPAAAALGAFGMLGLLIRRRR